MLFVRKPGLRYHERGGIGSWDFPLGSFTVDGAWHDLDVSSIVPAQAKVLACLWNYDVTVNTNVLYIRPDGDTGAYGDVLLRCPVANLDHWWNVLLAMTPNQVIQYKSTAGGVTDINLSIVGWWY